MPIDSTIRRAQCAAAWIEDSSIDGNSAASGGGGAVESGADTIFADSFE